MNQRSCFTIWESASKWPTQGDGGVGGLLWLNDTANGTHFCAYDGNGNIIALSGASDGSETARYEYGPFGEPIRATGLMATENPFRFSTKFTDHETDLLYYGYRFYNPSMGRWPSRDPIGELGGLNLYAFVGNSPVVYFDVDGRLSERACQTAVDNGLQNNAKAKATMAEMKKRGCPDPAPICRDCCGEEEKAPYAAYFDPKTKVIHICSNKRKNGSEVIQTLVHELIHALDDCKGTKWGDCGDRACSEIRAVDCAGQCAPGGSHRLPGESYRQCVERVATSATMANPKCNAQHVKDKLNECMGTCP
jgi:RHS repeat-associated protein